MPAPGLAELRDLLPRPRKLLLYIPAGPAVDRLLAQLERVLEAGGVSGARHGACFMAGGDAEPIAAFHQAGA